MQHCSYEETDEKLITLIPGTRVQCLACPASTGAYSRLAAPAVPRTCACACPSPQFVGGGASGSYSDKYPLSNSDPAA